MGPYHVTLAPTAQVTLALTAHARRIDLMVLLVAIGMAAWLCVAVAMATRTDKKGSRAAGVIVHERAGRTTIVAGGPFAAGVIVVPNTPADVAGTPEPEIVAEADRILAGAAALEVLWGLPAATARHQRNVADPVSDGV